MQSRATGTVRCRGARAHARAVGAGVRADAAHTRSPQVVERGIGSPHPLASVRPPPAESPRAPHLISSLPRRFSSFLETILSLRFRVTACMRQPESALFLARFRVDPFCGGDELPESQRFALPRFHSRDWSELFTGYNSTFFFFLDTLLCCDREY